MHQLIPGILTASALLTTSQARFPLAVDHLMIHVTPGAPERAALERAGFRIAPDVNHHEGQGTTSITVEFGSPQSIVRSFSLALHGGCWTSRSMEAQRESLGT